MKRNRVMCSLAVLAVTAMSCLKYSDDMPCVTVDYTVGEERINKEMCDYAHFFQFFDDLDEYEYPSFDHFTKTDENGIQEDYVTFDFFSNACRCSVSMISTGPFFENGVEYPLSHGINIKPDGYKPRSLRLLERLIKNGDNMYVSGWFKFVKIEDKKIRFSVLFEGEYAQLSNNGSQGPIYIEHPDTISFHGRIDFHEKMFHKLGNNNDFGYSSCFK